MSTMTVPGYYSAKKAAQVKGVAYSTVTYWVRRKWLPAVRHGRQLLIEQGAVHQFVPPKPGPKPKNGNGL